MGELIKDIHKRKPSYGYHRINAVIKREVGLVVSDNLVHKVCKILNIKSKAKHYKYKKPGEQSIKFCNVINGNWDTKRPFEKIVSDTTKIWFKRKPYDWTFYLDVFNNEIVGYDVRESMYGNGILNHRNALNNMLNTKIKRGSKSESSLFIHNYKYYLLSHLISTFHPFHPFPVHLALELLFVEYQQQLLLLLRMLMLQMLHFEVHFL